jgi:hypothetical protein
MDTCAQAIQTHWVFQISPVNSRDATDSIPAPTPRGRRAQTNPRCDPPQSDSIARIGGLGAVAKTLSSIRTTRRSCSISWTKRRNRQRAAWASINRSPAGYRAERQHAQISHTHAYGRVQRMSAAIQAASANSQPAQLCQCRFSWRVK